MMTKFYHQLRINRFYQLFESQLRDQDWFGGFCFQNVWGHWGHKPKYWAYRNALWQQNPANRFTYDYDKTFSFSPRIFARKLRIWWSTLEPLQVLLPLLCHVVEPRNFRDCRLIMVIMALTTLIKLHFSATWFVLPHCEGTQRKSVNVHNYTKRNGNTAYKSCAML